ncbi:MAG: Fur family transcriptional regulator [Patescibacteria group bacterium]
MANKLLEEIHTYLRQKGYRRTKLREKMLEIMEQEDQPISVGDILNKLKPYDLKPNKTTIYRELDMLCAETIINQIDLLDGKKRYEIRVSDPLHHMVCSKCGEIQSAKLTSTIQTWLDKFCDQYDFYMNDFVLEFFGLCRNCKRTNQ